ncbi:hypothetical protein ACFSKM_17370 [Ancylobacter dichloromethanicus]
MATMPDTAARPPAEILNASLRVKSVMFFLPPFHLGPSAGAESGRPVWIGRGKTVPLSVNCQQICGQSGSWPPAPRGETGGIVAFMAAKFGCRAALAQAFLKEGRD